MSFLPEMSEIDNFFNLRQGKLSLQPSSHDSEFRWLDLVSNGQASWRKNCEHARNPTNPNKVGMTNMFPMG